MNWLIKFIEVLEIWVLLSVAAAFLQSVRTGIQKSLSAEFSPIIITWLRFLIGLPFVSLFVLGIFLLGFKLPAISGLFLFYILLAAIFQIIGSVLMINLFVERNFVVGIAYSKTETIFAALIGFLLFSEQINLYSLVAILIGFGGVVVLSLVGKVSSEISFKNFLSKASIIGLILGIFHAATAVFVREATLQLQTDSSLIKSAMALLFMFLTQSIILTPYILSFKRQNLPVILSYKAKSVALGGVGFLTSICWFAAYALQNSAYVNAVGQVELIFSFIATHLLFKEKIKPIEVIGVLLIAVSILTIIFV